MPWCFDTYLISIFNYFYLRGLNPHFFNGFVIGGFMGLYSVYIFCRIYVQVLCHRAVFCASNLAAANLFSSRQCADERAFNNIEIFSRVFPLLNNKPIDANFIPLSFRQLLRCLNLFQVANVWSEGC